MSASGISVITASLPERAEQLVEAAASVQTQSLEPEVHMIMLDAMREGPAACRNRLLERVETPWVAFLDDDDELDADHLEVLARWGDGADLVFSWHRGGPGVPRYESWDASAYRTMLGGRNVIPITVLARTDAIREAGCFDAADRYEDYALWMRMLANSCRFVCVPQETWTYNIAGDGRTFNP